MTTNLPVDFGRHSDGKMSTKRKVSQTRPTACVVDFRQGQQAFNSERDLSTVVPGWVGGCLNDLFRSHVVQPCPWEVATAHVGVFNNVSGDVRKLHRDAEVDGMEFSFWVGVVENFTHEEPDGASDLVGVLNQRFFIGDEPVVLGRP